MAYILYCYVYVHTEGRKLMVTMGTKFVNKYTIKLGFTNGVDIRCNKIKLVFNYLRHFQRLSGRHRLQSCKGCLLKLVVGSVGFRSEGQDGSGFLSPQRK